MSDLKRGAGESSGIAHLAGDVAAGSPARQPTAEQRAVLAAGAGSLLISAAAGSGKTAVLVERFVQAVNAEGHAPQAIMAVTFTERAAGELAERLRRRLIELGNRRAAGDLEQAYVGTIHGFCARLLRAHAAEAGLDPAFSVLEPALARLLAHEAFAGALEQLVADAAEEERLALAAYTPDRLRAMALSVLDHLRSSGCADIDLAALSSGRQPFAVEERAAPQLAELAARAWRMLAALIERSAGRYALAKAERACVDFDDLELKALELLRSDSALAERWRKRFAMVMIDEFQDVNGRQAAIVDLLDAGNSFVVGDELQSIYGFRHADMRLFVARRASLEPGGRALQLSRNFRSRPALIDLVNKLFAARMGDRFRPLSAGRAESGSEQPPPGAGSAHGTPVPADGSSADGDPADGSSADGDPADGSPVRRPLAELCLVDSDSARKLQAPPGSGELARASGARRVEALALAARLRELIDERLAAAGEIAVLFRAKRSIGVYAEALRQQGIAVRAATGGFFEIPVVLELHSMLRALCNPLDEQALFSTLTGRFAGAGGGIALHELAALLRALREAAGARGPIPEQQATAGAVHRAAYELLGQVSLPGDAPAALTRCHAAARAALAALDERRVSLQRTGIAELIIAADWESAACAGSGQRRLEELANVRKLARLARGFSAKQGPDLRGFLDYLKLCAEDAGATEPEAPVAADGEAVRLMSIHAAKGLEFGVVCLPELGARTGSQNFPAVLLDGERFGFMLARLGGREGIAAYDFKQLADERKEREAQEGDRVLYVGLTRARERLLLSGSARFASWPAGKAGGPPLTWLAPELIERLPERLESALGAADAAPRIAQPAGVRLTLYCGDSAAAIGEAGAADGEAQSPDAAVAAIEVREAAGRRRPVDQPTAEQPTVEQPTAALPTAERPAAERLLAAALPLQSPEGAQPVAAPALPELLTYSNIAARERCGLRYRLQRQLRIPNRRQAAVDGLAGEASVLEAGGRREMGASLSAAERGNLVHAFFEHAASAPRGREELEVAIAELAASQLGKLPARALREPVELIAGALAGTLAAELAFPAGARREQRFAFRLQPEGALITGAFDAIVKLPRGALRVIDYKSDVVAETTDLELLTAERYGLQRELYALAGLRAGASSVEVVHWFLAVPEHAARATYPASAAEQLSGRLTAILRRLGERGFAASEQPGALVCADCPARGSICPLPLERTLG